jgi:hypothetical protein
MRAHRDAVAVQPPSPLTSTAPRVRNLRNLSTVVVFFAPIAFASAVVFNPGDDLMSSMIFASA